MTREDIDNIISIICPNDGSGCVDPYDYLDTYKFCPNCGCSMVSPQESEEV